MYSKEQTTWQPRPTWTNRAGRDHQPYQRDLGAILMGGNPASLHTSGTYKGSRQYASRLDEPKGGSPRLLHQELFRGIALRFRRPEVDLFTSHLNHQVSSPPGRGHGCADISVAPRPSVRIPSAKCNKKDERTMCVCDTGGSMVALQTMVLHAPPPIMGNTLSAPVVWGHAASGSHLPSTFAQFAPDCLATERRRLLDLGLSAAVMNTLLASRRDSTNRIYNGTQKVFHKWCSTSSLDPLTVSYKSVLDFLQDKIEA